MKANRLSVREQSQLISALRNIAGTDHIPKKDLKTLKKILSKLDNIKITQLSPVSISEKIGASFNPCHSEQVETLITHTLVKLGDKGPEMFGKENDSGE
ncbi:hypothetical protein [Scandinavium sp.]|uniref:hypothetical protein n=1 Tax=Scandinavium sp. TaxID=2830653 RepID=UPI00289BD841|nr:hypothetical protein [Scandinavium sp.]